MSLNGILRFLLIVMRYTVVISVGGKVLDIVGFVVVGGFYLYLKEILFF